MHTLTRKRVNESPECWQIRYAGVRVGAIAERSGIPASSEQRWQWSCGFYRGSHHRVDRGECMPHDWRAHG